MKGIILAGGNGSRLYPMTKIMGKQLLPVYDKPMIYYSLSVLMLGGIKDILIIVTERDLPKFKELLGDGSQYGINLSYIVQASPDGLPEAFVLGEDFIKNENVCLILGDNIFYGDLSFFYQALKKQEEAKEGAQVFAYQVADPRAYGVVEFDKASGKVLSIEEKPKNPKSQYVLPGLYLFDSSVAERAKKLKPSHRGETEIVDLIHSYLNSETLTIEIVRSGVTWLDTGTPKSLLQASQFIATMEEKYGESIGDLHAIALSNKSKGIEIRKT